MKKFDTLVDRVYTSILLEQDPNTPQAGLPQDGGPTAQPVPVPQPPAPPAPAPEETEKPKPLSPPGRAYLVDLVRRALEIDPKSLSQGDMNVFADDTVTVQNAAEIEKKLAEIIDRVNPSPVD